MGNSPFATIISAKASKRITDFAVSELIADKLPFTPSRLKPGPFAARIVSGAVCGAAIYSVVKRPLKEGAILGGLGAIAGAFAGYHMRRKLSGDMPDLGVALLEDALAIGGGILVTALAAPGLEISDESRFALNYQIPAPHPDYCSFAYSALASFRMGMSGSASFQSVRKSL